MSAENQSLDIMVDALNLVKVISNKHLNRVEYRRALMDEAGKIAENNKRGTIIKLDVTSAEEYLKSRNLYHS
ncbi:hypothetical protein HYW74_01040 [Candidatus Pacearchaeota archaeon]|nr:hypothetical protein [Candidatus Pacearchaeota archaeon]